MLLISTLLQGLMYALTHFGAANNSIFPYTENLFLIHTVITGLLIIFSIIYGIPYIYNKNQKTQYLITILVSQNLFGVYFYLMALFYIGQGFKVSESSLLNFTYITLAIGLLIFVTTAIRFYILLKKGHYRKGSKKDNLRLKAEEGVRSYLPIFIIGSVGLLFILQYLIRLFGLGDIYTVFILSICILLLYTMLFILPEQLVLLYCKHRFDCFNYNKNGNLNPMGRKGA
ncbi:DUF1129 domain-containing protein [Virgibacillus sp. YIM 98842]|uniref:DUF1129 domain-containing protein n=1 Tax=Virgibacillus sp. YIM 98842 TaxID=2663533 RepID=UPI001F08B22C|nr:DUF1129 domain-containing protein [Virgibacillus sp. YIM 98842]